MLTVATLPAGPTLDWALQGLPAPAQAPANPDATTSGTGSGTTSGTTSGTGGGGGDSGGGGGGGSDSGGGGGGGDSGFGGGGDSGLGIPWQDTSWEGWSSWETGYPYIETEDQTCFAAEKFAKPVCYAKGGEVQEFDSYVQGLQCDSTAIAPTSGFLFGVALLLLSLRRSR
jgi:hypothetical protein